MRQFHFVLIAVLGESKFFFVLCILCMVISWNKKRCLYYLVVFISPVMSMHGISVKWSGQVSITFFHIEIWQLRV